LIKIQEQLKYNATLKEIRDEFSFKVDQYCSSVRKQGAWAVNFEWSLSLFLSICEANLNAIVLLIFFFTLTILGI
jgi:hypothetical protein